MTRQLRIVYSKHLKRRLAIRRIPIELPKIIFNEYDERYFDYETENFVLIKKVEFLQKTRDMMIVYEEEHDRVEIITNLDYSRVDVAADARRQPMKLWSSTANGLQRSRCGEIDSPPGKKCRLI